VVWSKQLTRWELRNSAGRGAQKFGRPPSCSRPLVLMSESAKPVLTDDRSDRQRDHGGLHGRAQPEIAIRSGHLVRGGELHQNAIQVLRASDQEPIQAFAACTAFHACAASAPIAQPCQGPDRHRAVATPRFSVVVDCQEEGFS